jgi:hypothetical protein
MQELAWLLEPILIWLQGGSWEEIKSSPGFLSLLVAFCALVPGTLILMGIGGPEEWRNTPLARWWGVSEEEPDADWAERARDLDKDGSPDF